MRTYLVNVLIAIDQLGNALLGGNPDETISSVVGRKAIKNIWWALLAERFINALFYLLIEEVNHCRNRIEYDEIRR